MVHRIPVVGDERVVSLRAMNTAQVALVTGAGRGLGVAIAEGLAAQGLTVAVGARTLEAATAVATSIGGDAFPVLLDITDDASIAAAVAEIVARTGRLDVLVNNAGGHYDAFVAPSAVTAADIADSIAINLTGAWQLTNAVLPHMRAQGRGRIVNVSSRSGTFAATWSNAPAYGVAKAALNMYTLQLANELQGSGILVNACCPGWVRTEMGGPDADKSLEEGADTPIWLALLPDDGPSGQIFGERQPIAW